MKNLEIVSSDVVKHYKTKQVLRGLSFIAESSKITFLAGKNGSGKTTWIRIACGLTTSNCGTVSFNGTSIDNVRKKLSVVFDEPPIYAHLSGLENLKLLSGLNTLDPIYSRYILDGLNIDKAFLRNKAKSYSLGQRHRLAMAAALIRQPYFIILDEPSIGLDPDSWKLVRNLLKSLSNNGSIVIVTGQDYSLMEDFCDKVVVLNNGTASFEGTMKEITNNHPVTVNVITDLKEIIFNMFSCYQINVINNETIGIECASIEEAEKIVTKIRESNIEFKQLFFKRTSLQEAFLKIANQD